jgi:hypothetical protein
MKRIYVSLLLSLAAGAVHAQTFLPPAAAETVFPSLSTASAPTTPSAATMFLDDQTEHLSNTSYNSVVTGVRVLLAAWSRGNTTGGGGFSMGYMGGGYTPLITNAYAIPDATDIQIGFLENTVLREPYAVVVYYNVATSSYMSDLYLLTGASSASLVQSKTLMTCAYNKVNIDVSRYATSIIVTWSDGSNIYTAAGKLNASASVIDYSGTLASPAVQLTNSSYSQLFPDVAITERSTDSVYYSFYNDSAQTIDVVAADLLSLITPASASYAPVLLDQHYVGTATPMNFDAPAWSTVHQWGYTYTAGNDVVVHRVGDGWPAPFTQTVTNGSMVNGPAAMPPGAINTKPVIAYWDNPQKYHLGWATDCNVGYSTTIYTPLHVVLNNQDTLMTDPDYLVIPNDPLSGVAMPYNFPGLVSFSNTGQLGENYLYSVYCRALPGTTEYEVVHKIHDNAVNSAFRIAQETNGDQNINVVPNPVADYFQLLVPGNLSGDRLELAMMDITGRPVFTGTGTAAELNKALRSGVTQLPAGHYVLRTKVNGNTRVFKIQKMNQ